MKSLKPLLLLLAAFFALGMMTSRARAEVSFTFFYDNLEPYGEWVDVPDYGYCWHPSSVDEGWSPYTDGYWAYTDDGWTWVSYEDFGGITYHYGRWTRVSGEGWCWVPGTEWAPAWVSWRSNDDYVGWAPLPPEAHWHVGVGFGDWVDAQFDIGPACYSFVGVRDFGAPALRSVIVNREENVNIINRTTNITNITVNNSNVYVGGPRYTTIAARSARPIQTLRLVRQTDAGLVAAQNGKTLAHQQGNQLVVLAPKVAPPAAGEHLQPAHVTRTLANATVDHGWSGIKDPAQRDKLRAAVREQAHGASAATAPARPVDPADIKLVQDKIAAAPARKNAAGGAQGLKSTLDRPDAAQKGKHAPAETGMGAPQGETDLTATRTPNTESAREINPNKTKGGKAAHESAATAETSGKGKPRAGTDAGVYDETPAPKTAGKKSKAGTSSYGTDSYKAASRKTKGGETNLQPFMGGDSATQEPARESKKNRASGEVARKADTAANDGYGSAEKSSRAYDEPPAREKVSKGESRAYQEPVRQERADIPRAYSEPSRKEKAPAMERRAPAEPRMAEAPRGAKEEKGGKEPKGDKKKGDVPPQ